METVITTLWSRRGTTWRAVVDGLALEVEECQRGVFYRVGPDGDWTRSAFSGLELRAHLARYVAVPANYAWMKAARTKAA